MTIVERTTEAPLHRLITVAVGLATAGVSLVCSTWLFRFARILLSKNCHCCYLLLRPWIRTGLFAVQRGMKPKGSYGRVAAFPLASSWFDVRSHPSSGSRS